MIDGGGYLVAIVAAFIFVYAVLLGTLWIVLAVL